MHSYFGAAVALAIVVALVVFILYAYKKCKFGLNGALPASWQNASCPPTPPSESFVGAFSRAPAMQECLVFDASGRLFNRCTYV